MLPRVHYYNVVAGDTFNEVVLEDEEACIAIAHV
jgi:hypothetical protein